MSRVLRQKHVIREIMMDNYELPEAHQKFVRIVRSCGNNLHEVESAEEGIENYLVSMPNKYRKNIWVKRGDVVLVEPIEEGKKIKAEICKILTNEIIKEYKKAGIWPERFNTQDGFVSKQNHGYFHTMTTEMASEKLNELVGTEVRQTIDNVLS